MSPEKTCMPGLMCAETGRRDAQPSPFAVRPWRVLHAAPGVLAGSILPVLHAQQHAGMRPYFMSEEGVLPESAEPAAERPPAPASLVRSWRQVRDWKRLMDNYSVGGLEIMHAHCFSAGMAAVRRPGAVVYDLRICIEDILRVELENGGERPWLYRSFRAAEQFVLTRAGAVVVHSREMVKHCLRRGVEDGSIFFVHDPFVTGSLASEPHLPGAGEEHRSARQGARSPVAVARAYDRAYRHAFARQRPSGGQNLGGGLVWQTST